MYEFKREYDSNFVGRGPELEWLDERLYRRDYSFSPIFITGRTGVGKTALVKHWLSSNKTFHTALWLDLSSNTDDKALDEIIIQIDRLRENYQHERGIIVVIDGSNYWDLKKHEEAASRIFNYKAVSSVIFIRQTPLKLHKSQQLTVDALSASASGDLLRKLLQTDLTDEQIDNAMEVSKGYPLALSILSKLIKGENLSSLLYTGDEPLYELSNNILVPNKKIISTARPIIISANNQLISSLKKQPADLHKLTPREFEILLADLLSDMGWEVELTKQTRDGGSDILAYLNTDIGRLLCLVEAKHYREDRKIGVDLVRSLYGTLCDAQANSAMLVTSSSFTSDAKVFQQKHQYQLTLRDYADIVDWILKFGQKKGIAAELKVHWGGRFLPGKKGVSTGRRSRKFMYISRPDH